jgi:hypothetical protein
MCGRLGRALCNAQAETIVRALGQMVVAMAEPPRRFPSPWRAYIMPGGCVVRDANEQALAYIVLARERSRSTAGKDAHDGRGAAHRGQHREVARIASAQRSPTWLSGAALRDGTRGGRRDVETGRRLRRSATTKLRYRSPPTSRRGGWGAFEFLGGLGALWARAKAHVLCRCGGTLNAE